MSSLYQAKESQPFHISVGAVVVNEEGEILVHKRERSKATEQFDDNFVDRDEVYILVRESLEEGETLEQGVLRGVREEFGLEGKVDMYLGALRTQIQTERIGSWEKTTLYFLVIAGEAGTRMEDEESFSALEWHEPEFLIERMKGPGGHDRSDLDESKIVEAYVKYGKD